MVEAQLRNESDVLGRVLAVEELKSNGDKEALALLQQTLNHDPFYGVRVEAAQALQTLHTDEARDALVASVA